MNATRYLDRLSIREGLAPCYGTVPGTTSAEPATCEGYRFPTDAEWRYAILAGRTSSDAGTDPTQPGEPNAFGIVGTLESPDLDGVRCARNWVPTGPSSIPARLVAEARSRLHPEFLYISAVESLLRENIGVKKCFVPRFRAGTLPERLEVKFNVLPSGRAEDAEVVSPKELQDAVIEQCLAIAISDIQFPETSGKGTTITYPFILQTN